MKKFTENKIIILVSFLSIVAFPLSSFAQKEENETPAEVTSLEQLILKVQEEALYDTEENRQRIAKFVAEKDTQQTILDKTLADLKVEEDRAVVLEKEFDENDVKLSELEDLKAERLGAFGNYLVSFVVLQVKWVRKLKNPLLAVNYQVDMKH